MTRRTAILPLLGIALASGILSCSDNQPLSRARLTAVSPSPAASIAAVATPVPGSLQVKAKYIGASNCKGCHFDIYNVWQLTAHNKPNDGVSTSFIDKKLGANPYFVASGGACRGCHVVGEVTSLKSDPEQDGYDFNKPFTDPFNVERTGIQCENCHGPGSLHVKAAPGDRKATIAKAFRYDQMCTNCHTSGSFKQIWEGGAKDSDVNANGRNSPHHPQSLVFDLSGGFTYGQTIPGGSHADIISKEPYNGCVTCHMSQGDPSQRHDIRLNRDFDLQTCRTCHGTTFSLGVLEASQNAFKLALEELDAKLIAYKKAHCVKPTANINSVDDFCLQWDDTAAGADVKKVFSPNQTTFNRAYWNFKLLEEEKSHGVHAPAYEKTLLQLSIDTLK